MLTIFRALGLVLVRVYRPLQMLTWWKMFNLECEALQWYLKPLMKEIVNISLIYLMFAFIYIKCQHNRNF